jgi:hypothetical protein
MPETGRAEPRQYSEDKQKNSYGYFSREVKDDEGAQIVLLHLWQIVSRDRRLNHKSNGIEDIPG